MGVLVTIVAGFLVGWITGMLVKGYVSIGIDMLLGIAGGLVGGWLTSNFLGANLMTGINLTSLIVAMVGAVIVVAIYSRIRDRAVA